MDFVTMTPQQDAAGFNRPVSLKQAAGLKRRRSSIDLMAESELGTLRVKISRSSEKNESPVSVNSPTSISNNDGSTTSQEVYRFDPLVALENAVKLASFVIAPESPNAIDVQNDVDISEFLSDEIFDINDLPSEPPMLTSHNSLIGGGIEGFSQIVAPSEVDLSWLDKVSSLTSNTSTATCMTTKADNFVKCMTRYINNTL